MTEQLPLIEPIAPAAGRTPINGRCQIWSKGTERVVLVSGFPVHEYSGDDPVATAYAGVMLVQGGHAAQVEVARAFGCSERTVRRNVKRYSEEGMAGLAGRSGWTLGRRRISARRRRQIRKMKENGLSNSEIARRLCVSETAVRKQVGPAESVAQPLPLPFVTPPPSEPFLSTTAEPEGTVVPMTEATPVVEKPLCQSMDTDPLDRSWDRLLACAGQLDDAVPMFADAELVPKAGVLFAVPALVASGLLGVVGKVYGRIGPAFYGLRTTLVVLLFMTLWRIQRPEGLKESDPQVLGRVLGLDRAPEVKTLRRQLGRIASLGKAERVGMDLASLQAERRGFLMGFLYVDGHVRTYHGKHTIPKAHVARMRLSMPATTDYWVNDATGEPLFVVTAKANAGMTKMLPIVLGEAQKMVKDRRITVVFDRGGWSPRLFKELVQKHDILTYRKGKVEDIDPALFKLRQVAFDGQKFEYWLHDKEIEFLGGELRLRQVTRLTKNGHQTQIVTSRKDIADTEVAWRMFNRWRQENFFKYMRAEFLLDALIDYGVEPDDPTRTVPNPDVRSSTKQIKATREELTRLEQAYGAAVLDVPSNESLVDENRKNILGEQRNLVIDTRKRIDELRQRRDRLPDRVPVRDISPEAIVKLATERKLLTTIVKMIAYQAESSLLTLIQPHYPRALQEGRTLMHELFHASADIRVDSGLLRVTLANLSSPHRSEAIRSICGALNDASCLFPGSTLRLHFDVRPPPSNSLAFPGPRQPSQPL